MTAPCVIEYILVTRWRGGRKGGQDRVCACDTRVRSRQQKVVNLNIRVKQFAMPESGERKRLHLVVVDVNYLFFFALCCLGKIPGGAPFSQLHNFCGCQLPLGNSQSWCQIHMALSQSCLHRIAHQWPVTGTWALSPFAMNGLRLDTRETTVRILSSCCTRCGSKVTRSR